MISTGGIGVNTLLQPNLHFVCDYRSYFCEPNIEGFSPTTLILIELFSHEPGYQVYDLCDDQLSSCSGSISVRGSKDKGSSKSTVFSTTSEVCMPGTGGST